MHVWEVNYSALTSIEGACPTNDCLLCVCVCACVRGCCSCGCRWTQDIIGASSLAMFSLWNCAFIYVKSVTS